MARGTTGARPELIAPGVYRVATGHGLTGANVYLVRSRAGWALIDTAWPHRGQLIRAAAEAVFGAGTRPDAIVLTHIHPDHAGSAAELARLWDLPVHVHPAELPMAPGRYLPEYANPLDRWLIAPLLALTPRHTVAASQARSSLVGTARGFDPAAGVPGLPDWQAVPTPGHTPGHVAFFRARRPRADHRRCRADSECELRPWLPHRPTIRSAGRHTSPPGTGQRPGSPSRRSPGSSRRCWPAGTAAR